MKKMLIGWLLLPVAICAQSKPASNPVHKNTIKPAAPADSFTINGYIKGYPDGTVVSLLNPQTGTPDEETTISKDKFVLKGKMANTDFRMLQFNHQPPFITLFLENSHLRIAGSKDSLDRVMIRGSQLQTDFEAFTRVIQPYQFLFTDDAPYDSLAIEDAIKVCKDFAVTHRNSLAATLAVIRYGQISDNDHQLEALYNELTQDVRSSPYGQYILQQINDAKNSGIGNLLPDFTQADTSGVPVSLSAFRGKYVLIDFWASWCRPCRMENPNVVNAYNRYKDKNFTVLGVSLDQSKDAWLNAIKADHLTWTHVSDLNGWRNAVAAQFGIAQIPQNFLLDPQGIIIGRNLRGAALERKLRKVLH